MKFEIEISDEKIKAAAQSYIGGHQDRWLTDIIKHQVICETEKACCNIDLVGMINAVVEERTKLAIDTAIDTFVQRKVGDIISQMMKAGDIQRRIKEAISEDK